MAYPAMVSEVEPLGSLSGSAGRAAGNQADTIAAGAMHLAGGSHADPAASPELLFVGNGPGRLAVDFVDLTAIAGDAGGPSTTGAVRLDRQFGAALEHAQALLPSAFAKGPSTGVPGGAMQSDAAARTGTSMLHDPQLSPVLALKLGE